MRKHLLVIGLYILLVFIMTFPLVFGLNTYMPGFFSTDESYAPISNAWWLKFCFTNHLPFNPMSYLAYPFGMDYFIFGYLFFLINLALALLTNPLFTYNFQVLANLFLSAFFTYLLVYAITKTKLSAFFSGLIFGFCPYIFMRSWQHLGETYLWIMPLSLWLLFVLKEKPTRAKKILLVVSIFLSGIVLGTAYYTAIIIATFLFYLISKPATWGYFKSIILLLGAGYSLIAIQYFSYIRNAVFFAHTKASVFNPYRRPFDDLFAMSAKPLSYFLPSSAHPFFGKFTQFFVGTELYGRSFTEHTLYLGWVPLALSFIAFLYWRRKPPLGAGAGNKTAHDTDNFNIGFFILLAAVAWLFSQPPWWNLAGLKVYMPSFVMYRIIPMFRAYCRFGIVVMLAVAVLAGFGLKLFLERFKAKAIKLVVLALCCGLVLFEFWNWPPYKVIDVSKVPAAYYWLKGEPRDIVIAEYPLDVDSPNEMYKLYQTVHEKKMINFTIPGTEAHEFAKGITDLSSPHTAGVLKWMGVKYVLVHEEAYKNTEWVEIIEELDNIPKNPGLKFIRTFPAQACPRQDIMCVQNTGPIQVYEVIAQAISKEKKVKQTIDARTQ
ncbi:MAG: hypothetical protein V2A59_03715 [Candidatus Omnitrophota bacterium]